MAGNFADLTAVLTLDSTRFSEEAARVKKELGETSDLADLMAGRVSQSFKKQAAAVEQGLSRQALAAQKAGISVGQYKAAMRTLPAQFTDIATQLAGGQNPWLILLHQGGQVKDSFGGMIPMFRGLAGAITLPMVGVTSLAVATGALVYAWYQGDSTLSAFNKTLVLSGNQSGLTADRMLTLSRAGQAAGLTFNQARESLAALVNAGVRGGEQFDAINQSVARFASASGVEVDKVAEAFGKLTTDPTSGLTAMARQFRNVTAEQIAYVAQLQRSGDEAGALQAANDIATKGFDEQTRRLKENMGTLETVIKQGRHSNRCGMPFWISVVLSPQRICSPVHRRHLMRRIKNGSGTRAGASAGEKPPLFVPTFRAHGMTGKMPVWVWQRQRCSRIWKKPVNWRQGTGLSVSRHS